MSARYGASKCPVVTNVTGIGLCQSLLFLIRYSASFFQVLDQQQQGDTHQSECDATALDATALDLGLADGPSCFLMLGPGESHGTIPTNTFYTPQLRIRVRTAA
jgi:hypothetical protein